MKLSSKTYLISLIVLLLGFTFSYSAASAADRMIEASGEITGYDRSQSVLTVGDMSFFVDRNVVITNSKGKPTTSFQLTKGTKIKFEYASKYDLANPSIPGMIKKIWVP